MKPIPREPPVTSATFPASEKRLFTGGNVRFVLHDGSTVAYQRQATVRSPVRGPRRSPGSPRSLLRGVERMGWNEEERILRCVTTKGRAPRRTPQTGLAPIRRTSKMRGSGPRRMFTDGANDAATTTQEGVHASLQSGGGGTVPEGESINPRGGTRSGPDRDGRPALGNAG